MIEKYFDKAVKILRWGITFILIVAPFYATIVIWLSSDLHHLDVLRTWKEVTLALLLLIILFLAFDYQRVFKDLHQRPLLLLSGSYIFFMLLHGLWDLFYRPISNDAVFYGMLVDMRPVVMLTVATITFAISRHRRFGDFHWQKIILIPAAIVIGFGLLQMTVLPKDVLRHVGYNQSTVEPYQTVDNQPDIVRIQSTTRGPNPLGAYLIVIIVLLVEMFINSKRAHQRIYWAVIIAAALVVLYGTYSRSAQVGLLLSLLVLATIRYRQFLRRNLAILSLLAIVAVSLLIVFRHSYVVQNSLFHTSSHSSSPVSSNSERTQAIKSGLHDVWHEPFGRGVGSAGPSSLRNKQGEPRIAENYFLQLGQEVGILGMILFIALSVRVAMLLWQGRQDLLPRVLLASLVGLTFVNMVSHAWTDDTLAYIWWGLAGLALAGLLPHPRQKHRSVKRKATG